MHNLNSCSIFKIIARLLNPNTESVFFISREFFYGYNIYKYIHQTPFNLESNDNISCVSFRLTKIQKYNTEFRAIPWLIQKFSKVDG